MTTSLQEDPTWMCLPRPRGVGDPKGRSRDRGRFSNHLLPAFKKRALLIGIKYRDDPDFSALKTPHRDVDRVKKCLMSEYSISESYIQTEIDRTASCVQISRVGHRNYER